MATSSGNRHSPPHLRDITEVESLIDHVRATGSHAAVGAGRQGAPTPVHPANAVSSTGPHSAVSRGGSPPSTWPGGRQESPTGQYATSGTAPPPPQSVGVTALSARGLSSAPYEAIDPNTGARVSLTRQETPTGQYATVSESGGPGPIRHAPPAGNLAIPGAAPVASARRDPTAPHPIVAGADSGTSGMGRKSPVSQHPAAGVGVTGRHAALPPRESAPIELAISRPAGPPPPAVVGISAPSQMRGQTGKHVAVGARGGTPPGQPAVGLAVRAAQSSAPARVRVSGRLVGGVAAAVLTVALGLAWALGWFTPDPILPTDFSGWVEGTLGYQGALAEQQRAGGTVFVYFRPANCQDCVDFESGLLDTSSVRERVQGLLRVRVDPELTPEDAALARELGISRYPAVFLVPRATGRPESLEVWESRGTERFLRTPGEFLEAIERATVDPGIRPPSR